MNQQKGKKWVLILAVCSIVFLGVISLTYYGMAEPSGKLIIFHAGSLSVPMEQVEKEFEAKYPKVDVLRESVGSQKCARKITDLKKPCDIMASADFRVIDKLLIPEYTRMNIWILVFPPHSMTHILLAVTSYFLSHSASLDVQNGIINFSVSPSTKITFFEKNISFRDKSKRLRYRKTFFNLFLSCGLSGAKISSVY